MNTLMKSLLVTAMALSAAHVSAHTNKTYLAPRPVGQNLAMETVTFNELSNDKDENRFGGDLQVTGFYSQSTDKAENGKYFGIANKNAFTAQTKTDANSAAFPADLDASAMLHDAGAALFADANTISLNPSQTMYGARFDYHQDLAKLVDGLYFRVKLPVVNIKNNMGLNVTNAVAASAADAVSLKNFLAGKSTAIAANNANAQTVLVNAQMNGDNSKTVLADLELILGYAFLDKECYKAALNLGLIIPTGNKAEGKVAFEPVSGNGGHWALGGGLDFVARVWGDENQNIKFNAALDYRYAFEAAEKRTLGLVNTNAGQYGSAITASTLADSTTIQAIPLANILTMNVDVTPGSNVDMIAGFSYNHGGLSIDLGYNLNYKEAESVSRKDSVGTTYDLLTSGTTSLNDKRARPSTVTTGAVTNLANSFYSAFTDASIDAGVAATPSALTNKVYGQVGYIFKDMEFPVMLAAGGHYEFANENSAIENWGVNLKAGISF